MILDSNLINWFISNKVSLIWSGIVLLIDIFLLVLVRLMTSKIKKGSSNRANALTALLQTCFKFLVIIISIFIVLAVWGIDTTIGIVILCTFLFIIGLGAHNIINDVFSGMNNIFANIYEVGDIISINGYKGKVIKITVTKTQIQNVNGEIKTYNSSSIKETINYSRSYITSIVDVSFNNYKKVNEIQNLLEEKLPSLREEYSQILEGPIVNGIENIDNGKITLRITVRTTPEMESIIQRAIRKRILEIINKSHIELSFSISDVKNE